MLVVTDHTDQLYDQPLFWRSSVDPAPGAADVLPTLFLHGVPSSSDDWLPFLERVPGLAPDLPGFGRTGKRGNGDYTMAGYDRFVEQFLDEAGVERVNLVVHDWGVVGLLWAQRFPERVGRVVIVNAVPLGQAYRWHWVARGWRMPVVGELMMGSTPRFVVKRLLRPATTRPDGMPAAFVDQVMTFLDQGTQRAILQLYRTSPTEKLAAAGDRLGELAGPTLIAWGEQDPYIDPSYAYRMAADFPDATVRRIAQAGHWPWIDQPGAIDLIVRFLAGEDLPPEDDETPVGAE